MGRDERERRAYDEGDVWKVSDGWHQRFPHVFTGPNTLRGERLFESLVGEGATGRRVLEIGSGDGVTGERILQLGAAMVHGIDIAATFVAESKKRERDGRLTFECRSVADPLPDTFDLIVGRSILHHVDYREVLRRLHDDNLAPGGMMLFMEPSGSNPLLRLYWKLARNAHTPDERPFMKNDLQWLRRSFPRVELHPVNLTSFLAGIVSSKLLPRPNNLLMRLCDRLDAWLAARARFLAPYFRQVIVVIRKDRDPAGC